MSEHAFRGLSGYHGGKRKVGLNKWIQSHFPQDIVTYVEPFGGMLGILLARAPVKREIVNDLSGRLVHLWTTVRDHPKEFGKLVFQTPVSESEFERAKAEISTAKGLRLALDTLILLRLSYEHSCEMNNISFSVGFSGGHVGRSEFLSVDEVMLLWKRVRNVTFLSRCAIKLLGQIKRQNNCLIYCDPPYYGTENKQYGSCTLNFDAFKSALARQKNMVALSSFGDFYDDLGWHKHSFVRNTPAFRNGGKVPDNSRVEYLYTNYDPPKTLFD